MLTPDTQQASHLVVKAREAAGANNLQAKERDDLLHIRFAYPELATSEIESGETTFRHGDGGVIDAHLRRSGKLRRSATHFGWEDCIELVESPTLFRS